MKIKYAAFTGSIAHAGMRIQVRQGEAWDADSTLVKDNPGSFTDTPVGVRTFGPTGVESVPVEQATAAPGEKRTTKRRGTKKAPAKKAE